MLPTAPRHLCGESASAMNVKVCDNLAYSDGLGRQNRPGLIGMSTRLYVVG